MDYNHIIFGIVLTFTLGHMFTNSIYLRCNLEKYKKKSLYTGTVEYFIFWQFARFKDREIFAGVGKTLYYSLFAEIVNVFQAYLLSY